MSLELAKKALEDAQATVDKEIALENAIKMKVRILPLTEYMHFSDSSGIVSDTKTSEGDIIEEDFYDSSITYLHRHELESSINMYYSLNRTIEVMMVLDRYSNYLLVYTSPDGKMFEVHKCMILSYINESATIACKKLSGVVQGYTYSAEHTERLKKIEKIYIEQANIEYFQIKEYSKFIDLDLILRVG